jgi:hypothetical protein
MKNKLLCLIVAVAVLFLLIIYNYYFHNNIKIKKHGTKKYYVYEIDNILSSSECDNLIKYSKKDLFAIKNLGQKSIFEIEHNLAFITVGPIFQKLHPEGYLHATELQNRLQNEKISSHLILLKGSRGLALEELIDCL